MATTRSTSKSQTGRNGSTGATKRTSTRKKTSAESSAAGMTARARVAAPRRSAPTNGRGPKAQPAASTNGTNGSIPATDEALAASNTKRALYADMPRVAWLRQQLQGLEAERRERLVKVAQLVLIAIVFTTFVLQNAQGVNVHFLLFSLNIRLIWVIFGCGALGGVAGYLLGRPEKSLRALLPQKEKPRQRRTTQA